MPVVINIVAREDSNAIRDALTSPVPDAAIAAAFQHVERGLMGDPPRSRTALNGGWTGALALTRHADGTAEAQRTWTLTDAQAAASGLTSDAAIRAFAVRLADDVVASLRQRASRNRGGQIGDFWTVAASAGRSDAPGAAVVLVPPGPVTVMPVAPAESNALWWALGALAVGGVAVWVYGGRR